MPATAVLTEDLGKRYGETDALSGLDLTVEPGTVLGLLGHNGAGKTTAVRILTTLLAPTTGRAFVGGRDVGKEPGAVRALISLAGQQASLDDRLTGRENLRLLGRLQKLSKSDAIARSKALLERFGIAHAADRQVGTYSGGVLRARRRTRPHRAGRSGAVTAAIGEIRLLAGRSLRHIPRR